MAHVRPFWFCFIQKLEILHEVKIRNLFDIKKLYQQIKFDIFLIFNRFDFDDTFGLCWGFFLLGGWYLSFPWFDIVFLLVAGRT